MPEPYYWIEECPLAEDCGECKSGKNRNFWGKEDKACKAQVVWHLRKSKYHELKQEDAENIVEMSCVAEFQEEPNKKKRRGSASSAEVEEEVVEEEVPAVEEVPAIVQTGGPDEIATLMASAATAAHRCRRIADDAAVAFADAGCRLDTLRRRYIVRI